MEKNIENDGKRFETLWRGLRFRENKLDSGECWLKDNNIRGERGESGIEEILLELAQPLEVHLHGGAIDAFGGEAVRNGGDLDIFLE